MASRVRRLADRRQAVTARGGKGGGGAQGPTGAVVLAGREREGSRLPVLLRRKKPSQAGGLRASGGLASRARGC